MPSETIYLVDSKMLNIIRYLINNRIINEMTSQI